MKLKREMKQKTTFSNQSQNGLDNSLRKSKSDNTSQNRNDGIQYLDKVSVIFVTSTVFGIYLITLHPSLPGGDSGELVVAAHEFGVAHPPGYPLFTILAKLSMSVLPGKSPVWKVNILCAMLGALAAGAIMDLAYRLSSDKISAIFAAALFSMSRLVWIWSCTAEVFSLNNFLLTSLMLVAVKFDNEGPCKFVKTSYVGALLCGLCLTNQHTSVLYVATLIPWVLGKLWAAQLLSVSLVVKLTLMFCLGLSPYLYLPISAWANLARWTWGDQRTFGGFLQHLLRHEYGTWDLLKGHSGQGFVAGLCTYIEHVISDFGIVVFIFACLSVWSAYHRYKTSNKSVLAVFQLMFVIYVVFFCWRANLDIANPLYLKVVERFWLQSDLVLVVLATASLSDISRLLSTHVKLPKYGIYLLVLPLILWQLKDKRVIADSSGNTVVHDFAMNMLRNVPKDSVILTKGDLPSNSFRYFHLCEDVRPDLTIIDQEVLTYSWSVPMTGKFYKNFTFPGDRLHLRSGQNKGGSLTFTFKDLVDVNFRRPIFACIGMQEHEPSWQEIYELWPYSVCWQIVKKGSTLDTGQWKQRTEDLADDWHYKWNRFEDGLWEKIANEEMWRAKQATAFFYLEMAVAQEGHSETYFRLLEQAFKMYTSAMAKSTNLNHTADSSVPGYWHRNYAIICERLAHKPSIASQNDVNSHDRQHESKFTRKDVQSPSDIHKSNSVNHQEDIPNQLNLIKLTVYHFRQYLQLEPGDADYANIHEAINSLQAYIDKTNLST